MLWLICAVAVGLAVGVVVLVLVLGLRSARQDGERQTAQRDWAYANGFQYVVGPVDLPDHSTRSPFRRSGRNTELIHGVCAGRPARAFAHTYSTVGSNGGRRYHRYPVTAVFGELPPHFSLDVEPQSLMNRVGDALGFGFDTGDADFDRAFKVRTNDGQLARRVLRHDVTTWMRLDQRCHQVSLRLEAGWVFLWGAGQPAVELLPGQFAFLTEAASRLRG